MEKGSGSSGTSLFGTSAVSTTRGSTTKGTTKDLKLKAKTRQWFQKYFTELILRQKSLAPSKDGRRIPLGPHHDHPLIDERRGRPYISNTIKTARYNIYDFLPRQIIFQFTRVAHFYFLCIGIPQMIPGISTTGSYTTILPLMFFVLLIICKEGYDDWRRHRLDTVENARSATVLRRPEEAQIHTFWQRWFRLPPATGAEAIEGSEETTVSDLRWCRTKWRYLKVGDVIRLARDEDIPADIVLLHADGENGMAYIETMALDGETNLKSKQILTALEGCDTIDGISNCEAEFVVEDPNPELFRFDGRVTTNGKTLPLTLNEIIYRGCTLRNTANAIGMVINTGEECKIRRNADRQPNPKKPALEGVSNKIVLSLAFLVIVLSVGCSIGYLLWQNAYERHAWYLTGLEVPFSHIIIGFAIQYNNIIPLALYVSLEIVKIGQMIMLNSDIDMYDAKSDTPARCNTNTVLENLGQIGYIFSDKTGTLTENVMNFRKLSIAGTTWLHDMDLVRENEEREENGLKPKQTGSAVISSNSEYDNPAPKIARVATNYSLTAVPTATDSPRRSFSSWRSTGRPDRPQPELNTRDLLEYIRLRPNSAFSRRATQYILVMALCHTCLPEVRDGKIEFQSSSPDELALVRAAQDLGFLVTHRSSQTVTLRIANDNGEEVERTYVILDVIEFSSKRKRMSIVVRCPDGRIWLLTKGADSVILPRLRMAHLAMQKANELRKSLDLDHQMLRKSESREPRNSFGGRPSLTIRRSINVAGLGTAAGNSQRPPASRSKSFETSRLPCYQLDERLRPQSIARTVSFDIPSQRGTKPPTSAAFKVPDEVPEKYLFLEDPSICDDAAIFTRCFKHIDDFATEGLRTLLFAHRFLTKQEYETWKKVYHEAETSLVDRQERMEEAGEMIEQSLDLIGASAIEDKLQAGVPETIDRLRRANIKIWMLTGDKRETAINIAHSARISRPGSDIFILDGTKGDLEGQITAILEEMQAQAETASSHVPYHTVVVIDGQTLAAVEEPDAHKLRTLFYGLIPTVDSVICCRASPAQKALLVRAIRKASSKLSSKRGFLGLWGPAPTTGPLTLAIGDGANDLAMISAAHVGVGISGREGLQAARVADYSIAQFRFLSRLLLVHGRWNYVRTSSFILATFWKEMFFYMPTELYQRYNGYTGTSLYESWSLTVVNSVFTSLCVIFPAIVEQDLAAETLLAVPELYVYGQRNKGLNAFNYLGCMVAAASEGVLVWFVCWALYGGINPVRDNGLFALGTCILNTHYKNGIVLFGFGLTVTVWWCWQCFLAGSYAQGVWPYAVRGGFFESFGPDPNWWVALIAVLGLLVSLEMAYNSIKRNLIVSGLWKWGWKWLEWSTWKRAFGRPTPGPMWSGEGAQASLEEWDVELWQAMERDPAIKERLRQMSKLGDEADEEVEDETSMEGPDNVGQAGAIGLCAKKGSFEILGADLSNTRQLIG
ncbi:hypothetical protein B0T17DRAFT_587979 [Bombardia bombarda]|uniref:Phospholipid-transporting ATPase n=1 Tax=Bombardia bombarda TaxID=252184 RepID=A0AA39XMX6_9PEZI|nr:hypothetical protein B0T17DRAFT_587979 [Bombardia bombarda]